MSFTKLLISGCLPILVILNLLLASVPPCLSAPPVLPTPEALRIAYGLYDFDKEKIVNRMTKVANHPIVWDPTYTLENAAGWAVSCDMIDGDPRRRWKKLERRRASRMLRRYTSGRGTLRNFGFVKSSTLLTPWREWQDLRHIVGQWERSPKHSFWREAIKSTDRIGCSVMPGCYNRNDYYTVFVCISRLTKNVWDFWFYHSWKFVHIILKLIVFCHRRVSGQWLWDDPLFSYIVIFVCIKPLNKFLNKDWRYIERVLKGFDTHLKF